MMAKTPASYLGLIAGLVLAGCQRSAVHEEPVRPVRAVKVGDVTAISGRAFPGRASAKDVVDLSFQVSGPLISLPADVGSEVKKGDVIAAIDPRDFQTALDSAQGNLERARANLLAMERGARPEEIEQLQAALEEAQARHRQATAEHERNEQMLPKGAISRAEFDISLARRETTAAQVKTAQENLNIGRTGARPEDLDAKRSEIRALEAAVASAQNQLDYAVLRAPFDGRVAARYVDNFQTVQAKQPIVRLLDVSTIEVTVQVPESLISLVPQVKSVICRFDAFDGREFEGHVSEIGSEASETTRTYPVTVQVKQPADVQILPGMAATVSNRPDAKDSSSNELIVPARAVFTAEPGQQSYVWVVDEATSKVSRRAVSTGDLTPVGITIAQGLERGEWVVCAGVNSLGEGQPVKILQEASR
jgi:multidrug efflux pump subunit AcrA (membrane-fusion protein)